MSDNESSSLFNSDEVGVNNQAEQQEPQIASSVDESDCDGRKTDTQVRISELTDRTSRQSVLNAVNELTTSIVEEPWELARCNNYLAYVESDNLSSQTRSIESSANYTRKKVFKRPIKLFSSEATSADNSPSSPSSSSSSSSRSTLSSFSISQSNLDRTSSLSSFSTSTEDDDSTSAAEFYSKKVKTKLNPLRDYRSNRRKSTFVIHTAVTSNGGKVFEYTRNGCKMLDSLNEMRCSKTMCDVVIQVDSEQFHAHKCVLAASSDFFKAMFNSNLLESQEATVSLKHVDCQTFQSIVDFVYTSKLTVMNDNVQPLFAAANLYDFKLIKKACSSYMISQMDETNCVGVYLFAERLDCPKLKRKSFKYILKHFCKVCAGDEFLKLSASTLIEIIKSNKLNVPNESVVYDACVKWLEVSVESRISNFHSVLENVRLPLLSSNFLYDKVKNNRLLSKCDKCTELIEEAMSYVLLKHRQNEVQSKRTMPRNCFPLMQALVVHEGRKVNLYFPSIDLWTSLDSCDYPYRKNAIANLGTSLYFAGGEFPTTNSFFQFDIISNSWKEMPDLLNARFEHALVNLDGYIYAVGGKDKYGLMISKVERFDTFKNEWKNVAPLKRAMSDPAICTLNGKIYAFHHMFIQIYDPYKDEWQEIVSTPQTPRIGWAACSVNQKIYLIGGSSGHRSNCVECYDPVTDEWRSMPPMLEARYKPIATVLNNRIYVCSRIGDENSEISLESFDFEANKWSLVSSFMTDSYSISCAQMLAVNPLVDSSIYQDMICSYHKNKLDHSVW